MIDSVFHSSVSLSKKPYHRVTKSKKKEEKEKRLKSKYQPLVYVCACVCARSLILSVTASGFAWSHVRDEEKCGQIDSNRAAHGIIEAEANSE